MSYASDRLREFHEAFEVERDLPRDAQAARRHRLHEEEGRELGAALCRAMYRSRGPGILEGIAEELADVMVVAYGTADLLGIDLDVAFRLKMDANMAKLPDCETCGGHGDLLDGEITVPCWDCRVTGKGKPLKRDDGKILKGEHWQKPSMAEAIK